MASPRLVPALSTPSERKVVPLDLKGDGAFEKVVGQRMASRFVARWQNSNKYCVWDTKIDAVAKTASGQSRYENLGFNQAIDAAIELNGPGRAAEVRQQAAQQQQQPQPQTKKE
jgi:hypothetical protein